MSVAREALTRKVASLTLLIRRLRESKKREVEIKAYYKVRDYEYCRISEHAYEQNEQHVTRLDAAR